MGDPKDEETQFCLVLPAVCQNAGAIFTSLTEAAGIFYSLL